MKNLVFSIPYGIAFRNVVCCGIVEAVQRQANVMLLLPRLTANDARVVRQEVPAGVEVGELRLPLHGPWIIALKAMKQYHYAKRAGTESFRIKYLNRKRERPLFHAVASVVEQVGSRIFPESLVDRMFRRTLPNERHYIRLLEQKKAEALIIMKPGYQPEDLPLINAANKLGLPTVSIDTTWDNMVSKRPAYIRPHSITLWNSQMADQAERLYGFENKDISITGGAAFDILFKRDVLPDRTAYLRNLGLEPDRKLLVFTLAHTSFTPDNHQYITFLLDAIRDGRIAGSPNLVIRAHPWDVLTDFSSIPRNQPNVRIERPFGMPEKGSVFECLPSTKDVVHYGALMSYADVLINIASTTSLDAMAVNIPVVNIAFDMKPTHQESSVLRYFNYSHYKPIVETGAVRMCYDPGQLIDAINACLADPNSESELRRLACKQFLTFTDGLSSERVAQAIHKAI
jgi:hypothetical protein